MAFINEKAEGGEWKTIDRDRDIALIYKGRMGGDDPYMFDFLYKGDVAKIHAFANIKTNAPGDNDLTWNIVKLFVPEKLKQNQAEILGFIREAFDVCGFLFRHDHIASVTVNFESFGF